MEGFQYNGIHCSEYNVWYVPDASDRWFASPEFETYEGEVSKKAGGYWYGRRTKIRSFKLKCYYEDIDLETREDIRNWLEADEEAELIFDSRPCAIYYVRPSNIVQGEEYTTLADNLCPLYSGTFEVTFTAYKPYGFLKEKYYTDIDVDNASIICGMLEENEMPALPTTSSRSFMLYNCGTITCDTIQRIGGSGEDIIIENETNGTKCALESLPSEGYLEIDSELGIIKVVNNGTGVIDYSYHDEGFMTLAPYLPRRNDIVVQTISGSSNVMMVNSSPRKSDVGRYIYLDDSWKKISGIGQGNVFTIDSAASFTGVVKTKIVTMNDITITGTNLSLNKLEIDYKPMVV